jgi:hypothetical protein
MRIGNMPLLAAGLLVAGALTLGTTMAAAQSKPEDTHKGEQSGATAELPQSRPEKDLPPLSLLPRSEDELRGEDDAPGGHTCPDRGNTLELII